VGRWNLSQKIYKRQLNAAGEVIGKLDAEDVLGRIFSSFCIGK